MSTLNQQHSQRRHSQPSDPYGILSPGIKRHAKLALKRVLNPEFDIPTPPRSKAEPSSNTVKRFDQRTPFSAKDFRAYTFKAKSTGHLSMVGRKRRRRLQNTVLRPPPAPRNTTSYLAQNFTLSKTEIETTSSSELADQIEPTSAEEICLGMEGLVDQDLFDDDFAPLRVDRTYSVDVTPDSKDFPKLLEESNG